MSRSPPPPETWLRSPLVGSPGRGPRRALSCGFAAFCSLLPGPPCERSAAGFLRGAISAVLLKALVPGVLRDVSRLSLLREVLLLGPVAGALQIGGLVFLAGAARSLVAPPGRWNGWRVTLCHRRPHALMIAALRAGTWQPARIGRRAPSRRAHQNFSSSAKIQAQCRRSSSRARSRISQPTVSRDLTRGGAGGGAIDGCRRRLRAANCRTGWPARPSGLYVRGR